ncbi:MAG: PorV/PorQ family protein [Bacteroidetes bacterium]|nr:PorV/PorQ family protein [Bacteroidota bacterium]MCW5897332.1 PorV/PorQ family protein [Bacteroidota bacterium]
MMKYPQNILFALAFVLLMTPYAAHAQVGKSGLAFLKFGVSGRAVSMGDAMSATISGAAATHYNPAGLMVPEGTNAHILLMHKEWIQDVRSQFLGATVNLNDESALGVSVNTATVSDIEIRTRPGTPQGTFSSRDYSLGLSYARHFSDDLAIGITAKFLYEKIFVDEANGFAFDIGAQYNTPIENLTFGLALANLGSTNNLRNENITLPSLLRAGPAYVAELESMTSRLTIATDLLHIFPEKKTYVNMGGEWLFNGIVAARAGYQLGSNARGFSTGLGVEYGMFSLDYGFAPLSSDLGSGHTFSLSLKL